LYLASASVYSSSASRFTAGSSEFCILSQSGERSFHHSRPPAVMNDRHAWRRTMTAFGQRAIASRHAASASS
jgi:hypothetical protein